MTTPTPVAKSSTDKFLDSIQPFLIGGFSGMFATCIIQPVDMIKVTIQLKSEEGHGGSISPFSVLKEIKEKEGIKGFYRGYLLTKF
jgi:solute carrier family 25 oxoglutarate transporter 11